MQEYPAESLYRAMMLYQNAAFILQASSNALHEIMQSTQALLDGATDEEKAKSGGSKARKWIRDTRDMSKQVAEYADTVDREGFNLMVSCLDNLDIVIPNTEPKGD